MTQCEFCEQYLWNWNQTTCSGGNCSNAYEIMRDEGLLEDEEDEEEGNTDDSDQNC